MRMPNGYGKVFRQSGNRRRPWAARVTVSWTPEGKQVTKYLGYYETKTEALAALAEHHKSPIADRHSATLTDIYQEWSASRYQRLADKTVAMYETAWRHLKALGGIRMSELRKAHLQALVDDMAYKQKLSHSSCHKVKVLAVQLCKAAMADEIVQTNLAELIELPARSVSKKQTFTTAEIRLLEADPDPWAGTILILIYTGLRIGEFLSLTKFSVDLSSQTLTGGSKTAAGQNRIIPIHPKILPLIRYWYNQPGEHLVTKDGKKIRVDYYRPAIYYPALDRLGITRKPPHSTRHTFATLLDLAGADTKAIQELLGHTDYALTANIYTHTDQIRLQKAVEMLP